MTTAECIHGLEVGACDVCSPRQAPVPDRPRASRGVRPRTASASRGPKPAAGMTVRTAADRRFLVVHRDRLTALLAGGPLTDAAGWRTELGEAGAFDPIRWEDAGAAERGAELVVLVGSGSDPDRLELVAVANEPAKRVVAEILRDTGRRPRLVLNPAWFA